ncbi:MAG: hypothetical protein ACOC9C_00900 [Chloroflexota bacterium]
MPDSTKTDLAKPLATAETKQASAYALAEERVMPRAWWRRAHWYKVGLFAISLFLFVLALSLMKEGARVLAPLIRDHFSIDNPANSLGFGWLFAYVIMSGSPVAAAALTFFDAGIIGMLDAYTMVTGSRLGASLIVLFIGVIYILRGRDRATSLGMGLLSLVVTGSIHLLALPLGLYILNAGLLADVQLDSGAVLTSLTNAIFDPLVSFAMLHMPEWLLFVVGFGIMMVSFSLFDRAIPEMTLKESQVGKMSRLVYQPWVVFLLGAGITTLSMSVSVSLSILVPLSARGFVRRENVVPYIMGANVTTFIDTVLAAVFLNNPEAFTVILVNMVSITIVSAIVLGTAYRRYERASLAFVRWATTDRRNLTLFVVIIIAAPIILMLF